MSIKTKITNKDGTLAKNTIMLFLLTISNYVFNFITIPYQTRVLAPPVFGNITFAMSVMSYFQLLTDFGFLLSATEDIAKERENSQKVSKIFSSVMYCKLFLVVISFVILAILCLTVNRFKQDTALLLILDILFSICIFAGFLIPRNRKDASHNYKKRSYKSIYNMFDFRFIKKAFTVLHYPNSHRNRKFRCSNFHLYTCTQNGLLTCPSKSKRNYKRI